MATLPIEWGGMGLHDLQVHNMALLLPWCWRAYNNPSYLPIVGYHNNDLMDGYLCNWPQFMVRLRAILLEEITGIDSNFQLFCAMDHRRWESNLLLV